mgnify:CR=1 FL=1
MIRQETRRKYGELIRYIKDEVHSGHIVEYENDFIRVVLGENGEYYEFIDLPEEFSGFVGDGYEYEFTGTSESQRQLDDILTYLKQSPIQDKTRDFQLTMLYSHFSDREDIYAFSYNEQESYEPGKAGRIQPGQLPNFYKVKWNLKTDQDNPFPSQRGMMFFIRNMTDKHLTVSYTSKDLVLGDYSTERRVIN